MSDPRDVDLTHIFPAERYWRECPGTCWACVAIVVGLALLAFQYH